MTEVIFPSAQAAVIKALNDSDKIMPRASSRVPDPLPDSFVKVSRVGGYRVDLVLEDAIVLVECYAKTDVASDTLARRVYAVLSALQGVQVGSAQVVAVTTSSGLVEYYDDSLKRDRTQMTLVVRLRGELLAN